MVARWKDSVIRFLESIQDPECGAAPSVKDGALTLYGTCYSLLAMYYLGKSIIPTAEARNFVMAAQSPESGFFIGPELLGFEMRPGFIHTREHLVLHQTCAVLPFCQEFSILPASLSEAHQFCDLTRLRQWMNERDFKFAWFEGNNILFIGQLLVYLRDVEKKPGAVEALKQWFDWLDRSADPITGLWGTNGLCTPMEAVYGGYHQLLVYYYENHPLPNAYGLVDTVLALQHDDGGFNPNGNSGACEDVDAVDILVNCYKRIDYRRTEIRHALRRCLVHILSTQNPDGGFPYNRNQEQSHMGIPATEAAPNVSCTFPTWFRIHTLALIAEVLPNDPAFSGVTFRFNKALSMGWHVSPQGWVPESDEVTLAEQILKARIKIRRLGQLPKLGVRLVSQFSRKHLLNRPLRP